MDSLGVTLLHVLSHSNTASDSIRNDPLLLAVRSSIVEMGPGRTTVAEIARRADVSRMTVYRRFESLDRLLAATMTAEFTDLLDRVEDETTPIRPARRRVIETVLLMSAEMLDNDLFLAILNEDPEVILPLMTRRMGQTQQAILSRLEALIAAGLPSGDGSIAPGSAAVYALTCLMLAQPFVFSRTAIESQPGGRAAIDQLPIVLDRYLRPGGDHALHSPA